MNLATIYRSGTRSHNVAPFAIETMPAVELSLLLDLSRDRYADAILARTLADTSPLEDARARSRVDEARASWWRKVNRGASDEAYDRMRELEEAGR